LTTATKPKVLVVGAFPLGRKKRIYGGQVSVCLRLLESSFVVSNTVRTIDTTQISNPPPPLAIRAVLALWRVVLFGWELLFHRPDVALLFVARGASVYEKGLMVRLATLGGVPVMVFPRAGGLLQDFTDSSAHARFVRATLARANLFLCQGRTFQIFAVEKLGFDQAHAPIIPNWTAREEHLQIGGARTPPLPGSMPRLLFLGWLEEPKGVFDLLDGVLRLTQAGSPLHVTFGGDGSALPAARDFVARHKLRDQVTFAGWVDGETRNTLLRESDIFVLPSWNEGLPNAMIEAMSARLACVLTDVGMISDYVVDGHDALVVPARNVAALTSAIARLLADPVLRARLADNGHALARSQFSLEGGVDRLNAAIRLAVQHR